MDLDDERPPIFSAEQLDVGAMPASTDALRAVLSRHRHRQSRLLGVVAVVVLLAGAGAGFAIGTSANNTTQLSAGAAPNTPPAAAPQPANVASSSSGGFLTTAGPATPIPSTQLLVRNATDGTRIRLYQEDISAKVKCPPNEPCAAPPPDCLPTSVLTAEVSDDQVAGTSGGPVWKASSATGLDPISAMVVGDGQPQPILVALAHAGTNVAKVQLTTAYGTDTQVIPAGGGWAALGLQLPATYTRGANGNPAGTVTALSATGATISQTSLDQMDAKSPGPCQPPPCPGAPQQAPTTTGATHAPTTTAASNAPSTTTCQCPAPPATPDQKKAAVACSFGTGPGVSGGSVSNSGGGSSGPAGTSSGTTVSSGA